MKRGWTLIEMLITITIVAIMFTFIYKSIDLAKYSNKWISKKVEIKKRKKAVFELFLRDFLYKKMLKVVSKDKHFDTIYLQSSNSLYGNSKPYIIYMVKDNNLYRVESIKNINISNLTDEYNADLILKGIEKFKLFFSKIAIMVYIQQHKKRIIYQIPLIKG